MTTDRRSGATMRRDAPIAWIVAQEPVGYLDAVDAMETRAEAIRRGESAECIWLVQHPPLFTAGTSARAADLALSPRFPVFRSGRGGQFTYHGPGQRVLYALVDLDERGRDIRAFVGTLEAILIDALAQFGVTGETRGDRVGVWVRRPSPEPAEPEREEKIAAIGVRVRRWVTLHGASLNVDPDLGHYADIVPCGLRDFGVTSLAALGRHATMDEVDRALRLAVERRLGPTFDGSFSRP